MPHPTPSPTTQTQICVVQVQEKIPQRSMTYVCKCKRTTYVCKCKRRSHSVAWHIFKLTWTLLPPPHPTLTPNDPYAYSIAGFYMRAWVLVGGDHSTKPTPGGRSATNFAVFSEGQKYIDLTFWHGPPWKVALKRWWWYDIIGLHNGKFISTIVARSPDHCGCNIIWTIYSTRNYKLQPFN